MAIQATGVLLDGCVLSLLARADAYGYSLTQQMKASLGVSESTLYPVMRRLQTDDCLTVYDEPHNGRNRRYYRITQRGHERFRDCAAQWADFKTRVDEIILPQEVINPISDTQIATQEAEYEAENNEILESMKEEYNENLHTMEEEHNESPHAMKGEHNESQQAKEGEILND